MKIDILTYFDIDNMSLLGWTDVCSNCVCGIDNRKALGIAFSRKQCYQKCIYTLGCYAVEYWAGDANTNNCFNCIDLSKLVANDGEGHPPSVHKQGIPRS